MTEDNAKTKLTLSGKSTLTLKLGSAKTQSSDNKKIVQVEVRKKRIITPGAPKPEKKVEKAASSDDAVNIPSDSPLIFEDNGRTVAGVKDKSIAKAVIPNGVKKIGQEAFNGCQHLAEVVLPDTLESIDIRAFYACNKLKKMNQLYTESMFHEKIKTILLSSL